MAEAKTWSTHEESLSFWGRIVAGQSHEVTNVLNIINELVGLQQDLLRPAKAGKTVDLGRIDEICQKVSFQVQRGEEIIRQINRFAHAVDSPRTVYELSEVVGRIGFLAERWTRLKRRRLTVALPETSVAIEGSPYFLMQAIFHCIDIFLSDPEASSDIELRCSNDHLGAHVIVAGAAPFAMSEAIESKREALLAAVTVLHGRLVSQPGEGNADFDILIPLSV